MTEPFVIRFDESGLEGMKDFILAFPERIGNALRRAANAGAQWIIRGTPHKTGRAQESWSVIKISDLAFSIASTQGPGAKYTPFLERGTFKYGPFNTMPKTAFQKTVAGNPTKAALKIKGGYPGKHMVANNMEAIGNRMNEEMQKEFQRFEDETR